MMAPTNPASARIIELLAPIPSTFRPISPSRRFSHPRSHRHAHRFLCRGSRQYRRFSALLRHPELIRVAAPIYLKFGLRNSPDVYPSGTHLENTVIALSRERVRRANWPRK
jgi:hypothetical protein